MNLPVTIVPLRARKSKLSRSAVNFSTRFLLIILNLERLTIIKFLVLMEPPHLIF